MSEDGKRRIAVLMDGTNCYFEIAAPDRRSAPHEKRMLWVRAVKALSQKGDSAIAPNPLTLWRAFMDARKAVSRTGLRSSAKYWRTVNHRVLATLRDRGMIPPELVSRRCSNQLHELYRRFSKELQYVVNIDIAELVEWIVDEKSQSGQEGLGADLYMITTQSGYNIKRLFRQGGETQRGLFKGILTPEVLGISEKLFPGFWEKIFEITDIPPERTIVVGSNGISDGFAAQVGVRAVFILDRDGAQEDYFRGTSEQTTSRGIPLVGHGNPLPQGRFFTFIQEVDASIRERLLQVKAMALTPSNGRGNGS